MKNKFSSNIREILITILQHPDLKFVFQASHITAVPIGSRKDRSDVNRSLDNVIARVDNADLNWLSRQSRRALTSALVNIH